MTSSAAPEICSATAAGERAVERDDVDPGRDQRADDVAADEAGAPVTSARIRGLGGRAGARAAPARRSSPRAMRHAEPRHRPRRALGRGDDIRERVGEAPDLRLLDQQRRAAP